LILQKGVVFIVVIVGIGLIDRQIVVIIAQTLANVAPRGYRCVANVRGSLQRTAPSRAHRVIETQVHFCDRQAWLLVSTLCDYKRWHFGNLGQLEHSLDFRFNRLFFKSFFKDGSVSNMLKNRQTVTLFLGLL
jgi:hypothetical protein